MNAFLLALMTVLAFDNVMGQDEVLIGDHTNATYYAKQFTDIQEYLYSALQNGYSNIRIAQGTYYMARSLQINNDDIVIMGSVDAEDKPITILQLNNTKVLGLAVFVLKGVSNVSISNLVLDGYNNASNASFELNGIAFVNVTEGSLSGVVLKSFRNGVYVNISTALTFHKINVSSSQYDGLLIRNTTNIEFFNSSTCCNGRHGINFFGNLTNITISSNTISSHKIDNACAVRVEDANGVFVESNNIFNNQVGVCLKSVSGVQLLSNVINSTKESKCIYISGITSSQFIKNECNAKVIDPLVPPPAPSPKIVVATPPPPPPPKRKYKSSSYKNNMIIIWVTVSVVVSVITLVVVVIAKKWRR